MIAVSCAMQKRDAISTTAPIKRKRHLYVEHPTRRPIVPNLRGKDVRAMSTDTTVIIVGSHCGTLWSRFLATIQTSVPGGSYHGE